MKRKKILLIASGTLTVLLCAALCASVVALYRSGMARRAETGSSTAPIFTREAVGRQLTALSPLAGLWLAAAIAAGASGCAAPGSEKTDPQTEQVLRLLNARVIDPPPEAKQEQKNRKVIRAVCCLFVLLCCGWGLVWLLNGSHFQSWDLERVIGAMLAHILPPLALGFAALLLSVYLCDRSRRREMNVLLDVIQNSPPPAAPASGKDAPETGRRGALRAALYAAAAVLIVLGVLNGGLRDVLVKAINICTECIGLG